MTNNYFMNFPFLYLFLACENGTHSQLYGNTITHLFETMNSSWCISILNLNEIVSMHKTNVDTL